MRCSVFTYCNWNERLSVQFLYRIEDFTGTVIWYVSWPQEWSCCYIAFFVFFCFTPWPIIKICFCIKQSILHSCWCLISNEKPVITQESVVFQRGNPKNWSVYCKHRGSSGNTFISMAFSILYTFFVIYTVLIAETFHRIICNRQLFRNTKNPAHGLKAM